MHTTAATSRLKRLYWKGRASFEIKETRFWTLHKIGDKPEKKKPVAAVPVTLPTTFCHGRFSIS